MRSVISLPVRGSVIFDRNAPVIAPEAPNLLSVTAGNGENALTWTASAGAISYTVFFSTSPGVTTLDTSIPLGDTTNFTHSGLINGTTYYYRIQANGPGGGVSPLSNELSGTPVSDVFANSSSLQYNGVGQYGIIPFEVSAPLRFSRSQARSYSFWINPEILNFPGVILWDNRVGSSTSIGAGTMIGFTIDNLFINIGTDSGNIQKTVIQDLPINTWTHVCITYQGSSNVSGIKIYFNGAIMATTEIGTTIAGATTYTSAHNILVGALGTTSGSTRYYLGYMDEVSIFNRELTFSEVSELYNSGSPADLLNHSRVADLLAWWRFGDAGDTPGIVFNKVDISHINLINGPTYSTEVP